jgi:hypothetical protein
MTHPTTATITELPVPSSKHATCAWCRKRFDTITELLDHADNGHFDAESETSTVRSAA